MSSILNELFNKVYQIHGDALEETIITFSDHNKIMRIPSRYKNSFESGV